MKFLTETGASLSSNNPEVIAQLEKYYTPVVAPEKVEKPKAAPKKKPQVEE